MSDLTSGLVLLFSFYAVLTEKLNKVYGGFSYIYIFTLYVFSVKYLQIHISHNEDKEETGILHQVKL